MRILKKHCFSLKERVKGLIKAIATLNLRQIRTLRQIQKKVGISTIRNCFYQFVELE